MQESSSDFLTRVAVSVLGFLGVGGLLGWAQYKLAARRAPTDMRLAEAQTSVQRATEEEIRARVRRADEDSAVGNLRTVAQELRADVQRLREERDYWRQRAEKAERHLLEQSLEEQLPMKPDGEGKG